MRAGPQALVRARREQRARCDRVRQPLLGEDPRAYRGDVWRCREIWGGIGRYREIEGEEALTVGEREQKLERAPLRPADHQVAHLVRVRVRVRVRARVRVRVRKADHQRAHLVRGLRLHVP